MKVKKLTFDDGRESFITYPGEECPIEVGIMGRKIVKTEEIDLTLKKNLKVKKELVRRGLLTNEDDTRIARNGETG